MKDSDGVAIAWNGQNTVTLHFEEWCRWMLNPLPFGWGILSAPKDWKLP